MPASALPCARTKARIFLPTAAAISPRLPTTDATHPTSVVRPALELPDPLFQLEDVARLREVGFAVALLPTGEPGVESGEPSARPRAGGGSGCRPPGPVP